MFFTITDAGIHAAATAQSGGPKITIKTYKLGAAAGYQPLATDTALRGEILNSGVIANYTVTNDNEVEYTINLDETLGNFTYGEIGLYLDDGTLFALGAMAGGQPKLKSTTQVAGNYIQIQPKLRLAGVAAVINFPIVQLTAAQYVEISSLDLLEPPVSSMSNAYLCHNNDDGGNPILAFKNTVRKWAFSTHPNALITGIVSAFAMGTPVAPVLSTVSGSLAAGTYSYRLSAVNDTGETLCSVAVTRTVSQGTGVQIAWDPITGASGYKVYGRTPDVEALLFTVGANVYSVIDTGVSIPTGARPVANTSGSSTTNVVVSEDIGQLVSQVQAGKYILQFTSGPLEGYCRTISSSFRNKVNFTNFLGAAPAAGTTFEIYKSSYSYNLDNPMSVTPGAIHNLSKTLNTIGVGLKTFAMSTVLAYTPGLFMMFIPVAAPKSWVWGQITKWDPLTRALEIEVSKFGGTSISYNSWTASVTGPEGVIGATGTSAGNLRVTSQDTTLNYLSSKVVAGTSLNLAVQNPGANESLQINHVASGVSPGTYRRVTVNSGGHVTSADNPKINLASEVDGQLAVTSISASGARSPSTFLAGSGVWANPNMEWVYAIEGTTALPNKGYLVNTQNGSLGITLPADPVPSTIVCIVDVHGAARTYPIIVHRNGQLIHGLNQDLNIDVPRATVTLVFIGGRGWHIVR